MATASLLHRARMKLRMRGYPCVRQHDRNDCGPACLATIARHSGLVIGLGRVRELCQGDAMAPTSLAWQPGPRRSGSRPGPRRRASTSSSAARCP